MSGQTPGIWSSVDAKRREKHADALPATKIVTRVTHAHIEQTEGNSMEFDDYDDYEAECLRSEARAESKHRNALNRHPDCRDPDHPGCEECEESGDE